MSLCLHLIQHGISSAAGAQSVARSEREIEEEIFYMFPPDNKSDHMQQGLMTLHHIISLQQ